MSTTSENWGVRYPQSSAHPRGAPMRLDIHGPAAARGPAAAGTSPQTTPLFGSGSGPLPNRRSEARPSSTLLLLPGRTGGNVWSSGSNNSSGNRRAAGSPREDGRVVRFDSVVQLILVPSRRDLSDGLSEELWWSKEDYLQFRYVRALVGLVFFFFCTVFRSWPPPPRYHQLGDLLRTTSRKHGNFRSFASIPEFPLRFKGLASDG